jgi:hypothetical protein
MKNVSDKRYTENENTYFMFNNVFPKSVPWKNMVGPDRPQMTIKYSACALHAA